ncbi:MAG: hypothetical protein WA921_07130 [Ahrensia sp.]
MTRYSDAALLTGDFAHMAAEFKAGNRAAPSADEWGKTACDNGAEQAAQSVAKQIFTLQGQIDKEAEQLEIAAMSLAGPMIVSGVFPDDGDMLRIDGHLVATKQPVAVLTHISQLALTITKSPIAETKPEDDGLKIGFVIFDELEKRAAARKKSGSAKKTTAKKAKTK